MKSLLYPLAFAAVTLFATSCSDDAITDIPETPQKPDSEKEMISFSLSDGSASTRAGFTGADTHIVLRLQSNDRTNQSSAKYTSTVATAAKDATGGDNDFSTLTFNNSDMRYWDDAHGRQSLLSVYAVAVPNGGNSIINDGQSLQNLIKPGDASNTWGTTSDNTIAWKVETTAQTKDAESVTPLSCTIDKEDLVYSNNIKAGGMDGIYRWDGNGYPTNTGAKTHKNGRMVFFQNGTMTDETAETATITDAPGHFDKGHLVFNHALTRMTITLVEGEGFDKTTENKDNDFKFAEGTNITLLKMHTSGTLNLETGAWTIEETNKSNITKIAETANAIFASDHSIEAYRDAKYSLTAQMLPDYVFASSETTINVMQFTIDGNTYFITQAMLYNALNVEGNKQPEYGYDGTNSKFTMMQGKNYKFTIKVDKTKIDQITATLAPWVDVTAKDFAIDNSHVTFTLRDNTTGEACHEGINFYQKTEDLGAIYTDDSYLTTAPSKGLAFSGDYTSKGKATLTEVSGKYSTNWYYENNRTAYHFRTISDNAANSLAGTTNPDSYFVMTGAGDATLPDYHWGAPMLTTANLAYSITENEGYKVNIHPGLTATTSDIKITEMHMLSNIYITLETTTGSDKVNLTGATIKLTKLSNKAKVDMGTGYITPGKTENSTFAAGGIVDEDSFHAPTSGDDTYWESSDKKDLKTRAFQYAAIPQALTRGTGDDTQYVGITIITSDNNQYYIIKNLSDIIATSTKTGDSVYTDPDQPTANDSSTEDQKNAAKIKRWYPNHKYHYNIKITKKGIDAITCTVAKWVDVVASDTSIDLEN